MRERENLFTDYLDELRRKEKEEKHQKKEQVRQPKPFYCSDRTSGISHEFSFSFTNVS
jgi:hypothetical protein